MLICQIEKFLRRTGMPWTRFGRLAASDPRFVGDLRRGRTPRGDTAARIERFMASYLASIPRPDAAPENSLTPTRTPESHHAD